jgi:hypothetical protein
VVFTISYLGGRSDADKQFAACNPGCTRSERLAVDQADVDVANKGTAAAIALPLGGAALGVGVTLILLGKPRAPATTGGVRVTPYLSGTGAGVAGTF